MSEQEIEENTVAIFSELFHGDLCFYASSKERRATLCKLYR